MWFYYKIKNFTGGLQLTQLICAEEKV
jgi:hypothetical protein